MHDVVRAWFAADDGWNWLGLSAATFYRELPTPEERRAFSEIFPFEFYGMFGFTIHCSDKWPASTRYGFPFRRDDFALFLAEHPPRVPFDPPDLREVVYRDRENVSAQARGQWWRDNGWPMTDAERAWLRNPPMLSTEKEIRVMEMKGKTQ